MQIRLRRVVHAIVARVHPRSEVSPLQLLNALTVQSREANFPRNLAPNLTQDPGEHRKEGSKI